MLKVATMTVSDPAAACASWGLYSTLSSAGASEVTGAKASPSSPSSRSSRWPVMALSMPVIGRFGCVGRAGPAEHVVDHRHRGVQRAGQHALAGQRLEGEGRDEAGLGSVAM